MKFLTGKYCAYVIKVGSENEIECILQVLAQPCCSCGDAISKRQGFGFNPNTGEVCAESETLPDGFEHWIVKFNTKRDGDCAGELEYRYYKAALAAGVDMSPSRLLETAAGRFFATKRFDRTDNGGRLHLASAAGLLHANFRIPGDEYEVIFKLTDALTHDYSAKKELFRRTALNVFAHNRDDHLKNSGFLMDANGVWTLAPFYDFTYAEGPNGWHTLSIAGEGANPGEDDLLRLAVRVNLSVKDAKEVIEMTKEACFSIPTSILPHQL